MRRCQTLASAFHYFNNLALERGISMVSFMCENGSEMPTVLQGVFRTHGDIDFYSKRLAPGVALPGGLVFGDAFEVF
jgi:hypothetical protein